MSETFHHQTVTRSRKARECVWCGESIEIGQPYESYRWSDDGNTGKVVMHPECYRVMGEFCREEPDWPLGFGEFGRGSTMERGEWLREQKGK